jgi:hypothetical protein
MDKLGAELYWQTCVQRAESVDPPTNAVARLEERHREALGREVVRGYQARCARADHQHVKVWHMSSARIW